MIMHFLYVSSYSSSCCGASFAYASEANEHTYKERERERGGYLQQLPTNLPHDVATSLGGSCQSNVLIAQSLKRQSKWAGGKKGWAEGA